MFPVAFHLSWGSPVSTSQLDSCCLVLCQLAALPSATLLTPPLPVTLGHTQLEDQPNLDAVLRTLKPGVVRVRGDANNFDVGTELENLRDTYAGDWAERLVAVAQQSNLRIPIANTDNEVTVALVKKLAAAYDTSFTNAAATSTVIPIKDV